MRTAWPPSLPALLALAALLVLPAGCQREEAAGPLTVKGKIFIFNVRLARAYAEIVLDRHDGVPNDAIVVARFENPAGGPALESRQRVFAGMTRIDLQSPDMHCIVKDRPYAIELILTAPDGRTLQTIRTELASTLDQTVLPQEALVTGPAYDRNPEATGPDGRTRMTGLQGCPAR